MSGFECRKTNIKNNKIRRMKMKKDLTTEIFKEVFEVEEDHNGKEFIFNKEVKGVFINFGDGDILVENDNFGTDEKYGCFKEGKRKAKLHPMQIVFSGLTTARICHDMYLDKNDEVKIF